MAFDEQLVTMFRQKPANYIKVFEKAVASIYKTDYMDELSPDLYEVPKFQVQVSSDENPIMLRDLQSNLVGKIICIPGIITSTSKTNIRARTAVWKCNNCGHEKMQEV